MKHDPSSNWIERYGKTTETYRDITTWCDVKKDLKPYDDLMMTHNGILYDPKDDCFLQINDEVFVSFDFSSVLPKQLGCVVEVDSDFIRASSLPEEYWSDLFELGVIGEIFEVPEAWIQK